MLPLAEKLNEQTDLIQRLNCWQSLLFERTRICGKLWFISANSSGETVLRHRCELQISYFNYGLKVASLNLRVLAPTEQKLLERRKVWWLVPFRVRGRGSSHGLKFCSICWGLNKDLSDSSALLCSLLWVHFLLEWSAELQAVNGETFTGLKRNNWQFQKYYVS